MVTDDLYKVGILQVKSYRAVQSAVSGAVKSHGLLSVSEWFMLVHISSQKDVTAKDLAALLDVEAPLATRLVAHLIELGLVASSSDPADGRIKRLNITAEGKLQVIRTESLVKERMQTLLKNIKPVEMRTYLNVLETIVRNSSK